MISGYAKFQRIPFMKNEEIGLETNCPQEEEKKKNASGHY
jgi:hypothetical protein